MQDTRIGVDARRHTGTARRRHGYAGASRRAASPARRTTSTSGRLEWTLGWYATGTNAWRLRRPVGQFERFAGLRRFQR